MSIKKRKKPCCTVFICCADAWWRKGLQSWGLFAPPLPCFCFPSTPLPCLTFFIPLFSASLFLHALSPHCTVLFSPFLLSFFLLFSIITFPSPSPLDGFTFHCYSCSLIPSLCLPYYIPESLLPGPPPLNLWLLWPSSFRTGLLHDLSSLDISLRRKTGKATDLKVFNNRTEVEK